MQKTNTLWKIMMLIDVFTKTCIYMMDNILQWSTYRLHIVLHLSIYCLICGFEYSYINTFVLKFFAEMYIVLFLLK